MSKGRSFGRSLYWRIGFGFILFLGITLGLQVALFIWVAGATEGGMPERMGRDFAELIASEFQSEIERSPDMDLEAFARRRVNELHRPAVILFADGRAVAPVGTAVPSGLRMPGPARPLRGDLRMGGRRGPPPRGGFPSQGWPGGPRPRTPFGGLQRGPVVAPIVSNGETIAIVWVPPLTGLRRVADQLGSPLAIGALLLLIGGTALAALVIFRPAQARLRAVEDAARRFGEGDHSARAPTIGGDEVAAVAEAFNRMANDLTARQAQLVEADRARRQLLADVSHELMTPLTAIRGYAETLALPQFEPSSPEGQRAVHVIQEEGQRIERLVGDLLDLARFEAGGISLSPESVAVDDLFERVTERHAQVALEKKITLVTDPDGLDLLVTADPHRIEQALQNLASNAVRHSRPGGTVRLSAARTPEGITMRVSDTGVGIPAEHLPHVFDRFYKADRSRAQSGSGLGLSIVRAIVERHGGNVAVRSAPGVETVFEITLPA